MPDVPHRAEDLLRHRAWVRSLARSLVADEASVDDLEQETWLAALERPPEHGEAATTWLGRVVRSRAIDAFRRRSRRAVREGRVARPEAVPSAAETVERADAHRRVVDAVMDLEEPLRTAVLLRFFEGLPPREVARRTGVPVETARTRVRRGVERLRGRFASRDDRERRAVLLLAGFPVSDGAGGAGAKSPGAGAATAAGGLVGMTIGAKVLAGATAAFLLAALAWNAGLRDPAPRRDDVAAAEGGRADDGRADRPAQRAARPAESEAPEIGPAERAAESPTAREVIVRREDGGPVEGGTAVLHDAERILWTARFGAGGGLTLGVSDTERRLVVMLAQRAPQSVVVPPGPLPAELVVPRGAAVAGRVTLCGTPPGERVPLSLWLDQPVIPAALVPATREGERAVANFQGASFRSAPDGSFRIEGLPADAAGSVGPPWGWFPVREDAGRFVAPRTDLVIDCTRRSRLTARLVRAGTGVPLAGATATASRHAEGSGFTTTCTADEDGRVAIYFTQRDVVPDCVLGVCEADGVTSFRVPVTGPFDRDHDLGDVAVPDPWASRGRLRVLHPDGRPFGGAFAVLGDRASWVSRRSNADGVIDLPGGALDDRVVVAAPGCGFVAVAAPRGSAPVDVTLPAACSVRVWWDVQPAGAVVRVVADRALFDEPADEVVRVLRHEIGASEEVASLRNGDGGDTAWFVPSAGETLSIPWIRPGVPFRVEAFDVVGEPLDAADLVLRPGERRDVVLRTRPQRSLRGRVLDARGRPLGGASILVRNPRADDATAWAGGWHRDVPVDPDGRFTLGGVVAESVAVVAEAPGHVPWARRAVVPGGPDLAVTLGRGTRLEVRVRGPDGSTVDPETFRAVPVDATAFDGMRVAFAIQETGDGTWTVDGLPPGEVDLIVGSEASPTVLRTRTDAGTVEVVVGRADEIR